jgi:hypothetical protein
MNVNQNWIKGVVACGMALAMVTTLSAQEQQVAAKVVRIKGIARYTTGHDNWQPLTVGMVVKPGTVIQTGLDKESYVDLILGEGEGAAPIPVTYNPSSHPLSTPPPSSKAYQAKARQSIVRLFENTVVGFDKLTCIQTGADEVTDTQLDLKLGHLFFDVKKLSATSKFEIKLPNGVAGIRGTWGEVWVSKIAVGAGTVVVSFVNPKTGAIKTETVDTGRNFDFSDFDNTKWSDLSRSQIREFESIINIAAHEGGFNNVHVSPGTPIDITVTAH